MGWEHGDKRSAYVHEMGGGQYDERRVCDFLTGGEGSAASVHDCGGDLPCGAQLHGEWKHGAMGLG